MEVLKNQRLKKILLAVTIIIVIAVAIFAIFHGQHYFSRRIIRQLQGEITSYGNLSPLIVIALILLSTIIPPLPLPVPLIEIAAGLVFGFWTGFLLVWISQVVSSLIAFWIARFSGKRFFSKILNHRIWISYKDYLNRKGGLAIFIIRATMAAPFNIVSFLAGLSEIKVSSFLLATILGTIPEALLLTLIGSQLKMLHLRLWYLFIAIVLLGIVGIGTTFIVMKFLQPKLKSD